VPKESRVVAVITGDIIGSSLYSPADRRRVDRVLRSAFAEMQGRFPGVVDTKLAFRVTAGDEFQCVLRDVTRVLDVLLYLRALAAGGGLEPVLRFRASIGVGGVSVRGRASGTAFARARQGLDAFGARPSPPRWTALVTGNSEVDEPAEAILGLADQLIQGWTVAQWQAVRWMLLGETRLVAARKLRIAHQNVSKRLLAAGWPYLQPSLGFLAQRLTRAAITLK
jgi:hypothetical protein